MADIVIVHRAGKDGEVVAVNRDYIVTAKRTETPSSGAHTLLKMSNGEEIRITEGLEALV